MSETKANLKTGFTLIEMLVVIGVITSITGIFLINFNRLSGARNLRIAQNQLTTDIRKIQSFSLSSRNVSATGLPASYYIIKFSSSTPSQYILGAVDNAGVYSNIQIINLPKNIQVSSITVRRPTGDFEPAKCAEAGFSLPFGRVLMHHREKSSPSSCNLGGPPEDSSVLLTSADLSAYKNLILFLTLVDTTSGASNTVELNGISQLIQAY